MKKDYSVCCAWLQSISLSQLIHKLIYFPCVVGNKSLITLLDRTTLYFSSLVLQPNSTPSSRSMLYVADNI